MRIKDIVWTNMLIDWPNRTELQWKLAIINSSKEMLSSFSCSEMEDFSPALWFPINPGSCTQVCHLDKLKSQERQCTWCLPHTSWRLRTQESCSGHTAETKKRPCLLCSGSGQRHVCPSQSERPWLVRVQQWDGKHSGLHLWLYFLSNYSDSDGRLLFAAPFRGPVAVITNEY